MLAFHIGGEESEYVRVAILRDNGDGWFSAEVDIVVGGFRGAYSADFNSWAFSDFQAQLETARARLAKARRLCSRLMRGVMPQKTAS